MLRSVAISADTFGDFRNVEDVTPRNLVSRLSRLLSNIPGKADNDDDKITPLARVIGGMFKWRDTNEKVSFFACILMLKKI